MVRSTIISCSKEDNAMKILFVQPGLKEITNEYPPIGLLYLASVARREGHDVDLYDASASGLSLATALEYVVDFEPDILAISLYTIGILQQYDFIRRVKKAIRNCVVVTGGPHATALPEDTMDECPEIDFLVYGEGEQTFAELLSGIGIQADYSKIKGICYHNGRQVNKNADRPLLDNLDLIPYPSFDLIKKHDFKYARRAFEIFEEKGVVLTSRGCPARCDFCFKATFGNKLRRRSPRNVVAEMIWQIEELGVKEFQFVDDLFAVNSKWLMEFFDELSRNKVSVPWKCLARVNSVTDSEMREMKKYGCYGIEFGVESGNDEILKDISKGITTDQVRKAFMAARDNGLLTFGFFIFGHKRDTDETVRQTFDFATEISPDMPGFAVLLPFPGSRIYEALEDDKKRNWSLFNSYYNSVSLPLSLCRVSPENLRRYGEQADTEFYGRLSFYFSNIFNRKGINQIHKKELYTKWKDSLRTVNSLYVNKGLMFNHRTFLFKYIINRMIILLMDMYGMLSIAKRIVCKLRFVEPK